MRAEEDRRAPRLEAEDQVAELPPPDRVEAAHRLVEHDEARLADERAGHPRPLDHPLGEAPQLAVGDVGQSDRLQERPGARVSFRRGHAVQTRGELDQLRRREVVGEVGVLRQVADAAPRRRLGRPAAHQPDRAAVGEDQPEGELDRRRLSGPVRPEQPQHLAGPHLEVEAVERHDRPLPEVGLVALVDPLEDQGARVRRQSAHGISTISTAGRRVSTCAVRP